VGKNGDSNHKKNGGVFVEEKVSYPGQLVFGLDIGTRSVVGTIGYKEKDQFYVVAQILKEHESRAMIDGQIHDISKVAETINDVKKSLEQETNRVYKDVCIAAAGRVLQTITVNVEEKYRSDHKIKEDDLYGINSLGVEKAYQEFNKENTSGVEFYCVGYSVIQYYLNGYPINNLIDHKARSISVDLIATFLPDDVVSGLYEAVGKADLHVVNMTLEPIAAIQVAIPQNYRTLNIAMVDVGAGTSDISVTKDGSIIGYGMIPFAGDALTEVISKNYLCDFTTAERIKCEVEEREEISYIDIMGLKQIIKKEEIQKIVIPVIKKLAGEVAEKIKELNGTKPVSAVFVVGGGGKFDGFCDALAEQLDILKERVALRSVDAIGNIHFLNGNDGNDSLLVTPVGICLNFYEQNNNFIYVTFNGKKIKLYDNSKLSVVDATMQSKYLNENLFPKRGSSLHIKVNGKPRMIRGKAGEAPVFKVNGKEGDIKTEIHANDKIIIKKPKPGEAASMDVNELPEFQGRIQVKVLNKEILLPKYASVNGKLKSGFYSLKNYDEVEMLSFYTVEQILEFLDVSISKEFCFLVNHVKSDLNTPVYDKFSLEWIKKEEVESFNLPLEKEEAQVKKEEALVERHKASVEIKDSLMIVIVNGESVKLTGKSKYVFVDVFDYIEFDLTKSKGKGIVTTVNGKIAEYMEEVHDRDEIEIYWNQK
jgi:cell division protein FtsA